MEDRYTWEQFKQGDKAALGRIFQAHIKVLYTYGNRFSSDKQLVEDCIQDLFLEIWTRRANLGETDSIRRYLMGSLRRKIIRKLQRHDKQLSREPDWENYDFELEFTQEHVWIEAEQSEEKKQKLKKAQASLSEREREAIYLKYYAGLAYEQIGEIMQINYQSTRNLIHRALKRMREALILILIGYAWMLRNL